MKYHVMLKPTWQGVFRRAGIEFAPKVPCQLEREDFEAVVEDIGKSLCLIRYDEKGRPRPDWDKTEQFKAAREVAQEMATSPGLDREKRVNRYRELLEELVDGFFAPPLVVEETGETESGPITLEESAIPKQYHKALHAAHLHDLESIGIYLEQHDGDLTKIDGIGEPSAKAIMQALEKHLEPAE